MVSVIDQFKVRKLKIFNVLDIRINLKLREGMRVSLKLFLEWFNVIEINVSISKTVNEFTFFEATNLGKHASKKRIAGDIERYSKTHVARSLIHLTGELIICCYVELGQDMARW